MNSALRYFKIGFFFLCIQWVISCNQKRSEIPLAADATAFPQPLTWAVSLSAPWKITWEDGSKKINPRVDKIDLNRLALQKFDSTGFMPVLNKPEQRDFDWNKLPDTLFKYEILPSKPLRFELFALEPPTIVKANLPFVKKGGSSIIFDFTDQHGLVGGNVHCLFEDRQGFLWIGTDEWLMRYDGENLALYLRIPKGVYIIKMLEDLSGNIWVATGGDATGGKGVFVLDLKNGFVKHLSVEQGLSGSFVLGMFRDEQNRIWLSTGDPGIGTGINIIDENQQVIRYFGSLQGLSGMAPTRGLMQDDKKNIWIPTKKGITIVDEKSNRLRYLNRENGLSSDSISFIIQDSAKIIWAVSRLGDLDEINIDKGYIKHFTREQGMGWPISSGLINDEKGNIWLSTDNNSKAAGYGIVIIDPVKDQYKTINTTYGINGDYIKAQLQDSRGQIWIATNGGLNILNRDGRQIERMGKKGITAMAEDWQGDIWIGNENTILGNGIDILNMETGLSKTMTKSNGLQSDSLEFILIDHGNILISTNNGLDLIDSARKTIRHYNQHGGLHERNESLIMFDKTGNIWMGVPNFSIGGLDVLNPGNSSVRHMVPWHGSSPIALSDFKEDEQGKIWIATVMNGIYILDPEKNEIRTLENIPAMKKRYNKLLMPDKSGNMWIGTGEGIYIINPERDSVISFTTREGLIDNSVNSISEYKDRIYIGTKSGITFIDYGGKLAGKKWHPTSTGKELGILKLFNSYNSNIVTKNGKFLWGDIGLTILDQYKTNNHNAKVKITGIDIFNQPQYFYENPWSLLNETDTIQNFKKDSFYVKGQSPFVASQPFQNRMTWSGISGKYNMPVDLHLPHDLNFMQFHFNQPDLGSRDTVWYRYILEGKDKTWSDKTANSFSENYFNLPPGKYIFKVIGLYQGNWTTPDELSFTILPPWWQTPWAYMLDLLVIFGIAWLFAKYRSRKLTRENTILEEKIALRTNQLSESLEGLRTTQAQLVQSEKMASLGELTAGIAHEIQNPLNFVNNFSEINAELIEEMGKAIDDEKFGDAKTIAKDILENEQKISHHGKRADAIVKGMLQHSRASSGSKEPTNINALADEYLRMSYHGIRARDKSFNARIPFDADQSIGDVKLVPQEIGRVLLNLYNNAFFAVAAKKKRLPEGYEPVVSITTKRLNREIEIRVKDNGEGIPMKIIDKIFQPFFTTKPTGQGTGLGLSMSYDIIKAHGGSLTVKSVEGEGAEFIILIPSA